MQRLSVFKRFAAVSGRKVHSEPLKFPIVKAFATSYEEKFRSNSQYLLPLLGALAAVAWNMKDSENCGIIGVVGTEDASGIILEGLTILKNRGYDSAGIATISKD